MSPKSRNPRQFSRRSLLHAGSVAAGFAAFGGSGLLVGTAHAAETIINPFAGYSISDGWWDHVNRGSLGGIDYVMGVGTPLPACASGQLLIDWNNGTGGYTATIVMANGMRSQYLHLSGFNGGQRYVQQGEIVGYSGGAAGAPGSGSSTGPHLHWHLVTAGGTRVNPLDYVGAGSGGTGGGLPLEDRRLGHLGTAGGWAHMLSNLVLPGNTTYGAFSPGPGQSPRAMANVDGVMMLVYAGSNGWTTMSSGLAMAPGAPLNVLRTPANASPQIFTLEDGRLWHTFDGNGWKKFPSSVTVSGNCTFSMTANGTDLHGLFNDNGRLFHVWADGSGWHKGDTQVDLQPGADLVAVIQPDGSLQGLSLEFSRVHHIFGANGRWNRIPTTASLPTGTPIAGRAAYGWPQLVANHNGTIIHVWGTSSGWMCVPTGQTTNAGRRLSLVPDVASAPLVGLTL
ncbi:M23 family metallopeptidase [Myxococcus xanthus]|uniref:M23 family metallopeptidase n=2 Tax=Myxococcus xanthus TaxID=34 RepID=A0A7Y4IDD1_MYXXA|nr:M23 family metallopeptidase [Myxococcus xanthus]NOJ77223.1 M23 family metallopeptidase [Myxococcus xanthus]NOJ87628.1 M23 family metallopeptidase [Myxococcus xanthus]